MTLLSRLGLYVAVAALALGGAFAAGYHQAAVKYAAENARQEALWQSRETTYQVNERTAAANLADRDRAIATLEASVATWKAAADRQAAEAWAAQGDAAAARRTLAELHAAQDAQPPPGTCAEAFARLAEDLAAENGRLP